MWLCHQLIICSLVSFVYISVSRDYFPCFYETLCFLIMWTICVTQSQNCDTWRTLPSSLFLGLLFSHSQGSLSHGFRLWSESLWLELTCFVFVSRITLIWNSELGTTFPWLILFILSNVLGINLISGFYSKEVHLKKIYWWVKKQKKNLKCLYYALKIFFH